MPSVRCKTTLLAVIQLTLIAWPACAQTVAANDNDAEKPAARRESVERVEPDIIYIRENGELVPLINIKLDDIRAFMEWRNGTAANPRSASRLERLEARGEVIDGHAALTIELTIAASDAGWMRVPLRLGNFFLTEPAAFADDGEHLIEFDPGSREFVAWFRGKTEKPHRLTLRGLVPVDQDGTQSRLRINAPRAVFSELQLKVPLAGAVGQVVTGGILSDTEPAPGATQFRATGLANDFLLSWQAAAPRRAESPTALSVEGQIVAKIDGRGVDSEANLRVSSFGREFNSFQVSLPRGATLLPAQDSDYSIVDLPPESGDKEGPQRKRVEVRLKSKTAQPVTVKLVAKQGHDVSRDGIFDLGGFEVAGAVRQSGVLAVQVRDDWQVAFVNRQGVVQTDDLPPEMRPEGVVAGFLYFGQPYALSARVSPRQTRTSVEPRYTVEVGPHHIQLDATLKYHVAGAKVFSFSIELGDWQLDPAELEPATSVNSAALVFGAGNSVLIPLKQATTGDVELRIRARKAIPAGSDSIEFGLLRPTADTVGATELVVVPEDNVILEPQSDDKSGLIGTLPNAELKLPPHRQPALYYRSDVADPKFRANLHIAARRITNRIESRVTLGEGVAEVRQTLRSTVLHESASSFLLAMPQSLVSAAAVEVELDGKSLPLEPAAAADSSEGPLVMRLLLPDQRLGDLEFTVSYTWQDDALDELLGQAATVRAEIPLVMPAEGELIDNVLTLTVDPGLHVEAVDKQWTVDSTAVESGHQSLVFSSAKPQPSLLVGISPADGEASGALIVERAWLQTLLSGNQRFDRAVFRFRTRDRRLELTLPAGTVGESFRLDGRPVTASPGANAQTRLFALNENDATDESRVFEATYETAVRSIGGDRWSLDVPLLSAQARARLFYWQLVLPSDEFLLQSPKGLESQFLWQWHALGWSRQPLRDTTELETWSGATEHEVDLAPSANTYLFSGPPTSNRMEIATVSRPLLILVSSGVLLAVGLIWFYVPAVRRASLLFTAGVAVLAVAAIWPDLALLAVQSAALGLVLIVIGGVLERSLGRRPARPGYRSAPSSIVGRSSTHTHPRVVPPVASTQSAALVGDVPQA